MGKEGGEGGVREWGEELEGWRGEKERRVANLNTEHNSFCSLPCALVHLSHQGTNEGRNDPM